MLALLVEYGTCCGKGKGQCNVVPLHAMKTFRESIAISPHADFGTKWW
jgi:hypothetical protein